MPKSIVLSLTILMLVTMFGCSGNDGPAINEVTGKVTLDGKPLADALIEVAPVNPKISADGTGGSGAAGETDANGVFILKYAGGRTGAESGKYKVKITKEDVTETKRDDGETEETRTQIIPAKYNTETTLEMDVKEGEKNEFNFDLKSE